MIVEATSTPGEKKNKKTATNLLATHLPSAFTASDLSEATLEEALPQILQQLHQDLAASSRWCDSIHQEIHINEPSTLPVGQRHRLRHYIRPTRMHLRGPHLQKISYFGPHLQKSLELAVTICSYRRCEKGKWTYSTLI
ncbi:hypothetical protein RB195_011620 [Necator americanus]|uniref:Uncharacterized protein n=1 Tax=Necator americanus TaxID=51031 RepID=A0ABR1D3F4_NECAM